MAADFKIVLTPRGKDFLHGVVPDIPNALQRGLRAGMFQAGSLIKKTLQDGIQREKKIGRLYKRKGRGSKRASAPGQYAGIVTGDYLRSAKFTVGSDNQLQYGFTDRKATWLEEGTRDTLGNFRMKPRPALANATASRESDTFNILAQHGLISLTKSRLGRP